MLTRATKPLRKATNLSLDQNLVAEAKALDLNISHLAEERIAQAVRDKKTRRWKAENREAIESSNEWVAKRGLPLAKHRLF